MLDPILPVSLSRLCLKRIQTKDTVCFQRIQVPFGKGHKGATSRNMTPSLGFPLLLSQLFLATSLIHPGTEAIQERFGQFSLPFQNEDCFDSVFIFVLAACALRSRQNAPRWRGAFLSQFGSDGLDGPAGQHQQTRPSSYLFSIPIAQGQPFSPPPKQALLEGLRVRVSTLTVL